MWDVLRMTSSMSGDPATTRRRIRVALDQEPGDLLITGGQVVNVFNRRVEPADVVIADGRIAGVGCYSWRASQTISAAGLVIMPGLIDAHMHLESTLLTPAELARLIVPMGTTAVISDSHEVGNVMGVRGIDMLASTCEGLPLDLFFMASSCVPATAWEDAGASLGPSEVEDAPVAAPRARAGRGDGYSRGALRRARRARESRDGPGGPARRGRACRRFGWSRADRLCGRRHSFRP